MSIPSRICVEPEINGGKRFRTASVIFLGLLVAALAPTAYAQEQPANSPAATGRLDAGSPRPNHRSLARDRLAGVANRVPDVANRGPGLGAIARHGRQVIAHQYPQRAPEASLGHRSGGG